MSPLAAALLEKVRDQVDRCCHLLALVPPEDAEWGPTPAAPGRPLQTVAALASHLTECLAGFCAALHAAFPDRLGHFQELREAWAAAPRQVGLAEASGRLLEWLGHVEGGMALVEDTDLGRRLPTVFEPEGQTLATLLLANLEHLTHHKHQLYLYLRLRGAAVGTSDLYRLAGPPPGAYPQPT